MHRHRVGEHIRGLLRAAALFIVAGLLTALSAAADQADWKRNCEQDILRALANLTVVWKKLNDKHQFILEGRQYIYDLEDSRRCVPVWKDRIKSFQAEGTFVWWSRSAVNICEAGHRMSTQNVSVATDTEVIAFWRRRQWRYFHCIAAGQRMVMGMGE